MALPTFTGIGRLTADPELRFSASGVAVARIALAFNSRKRQDDGTWVDDKVFFIRATAFRQLAENAAETLHKGVEVAVSGRLETEQWEDRNSGEKRSAPALLLDGIGPNLAFATAKVAKTAVGDSGGGQGGGRAGQSRAATDYDDPWGSAPPAAPSPTDEPPF